MRIGPSMQKKKKGDLLSKVEIILEKSVWDGFYQNLAHMGKKQFSTDGTTFRATFNQFYKS